MGLSLAQQLATLPQACQQEYLDSLHEKQLFQLAWDWGFWGRPEQQQPDGNWFIWLLLCGRGFGKSRTTSEVFIDWVTANPIAVDGSPTEWLLAGKTHKDTVNVLLRGGSGVFKVLDARGIKYTWNKVEHLITLETGQRIHHTHGDDEDLARGLTLSGAAVDELGTWKRVKEAYHEALIPALRAMVPNWRPRLLIATTPKIARKDALDILKTLVKRAEDNDPAVVVTRGTTFDNAANLPAAQIEEWLATYPKGSRAYKQELLAEILDEVEGAVWEDWHWIDDHRIKATAQPDYFKKLIAVDPAVTSGENSDETGIILAGAAKVDAETHAYIIEDHSGRYKSADWISLVVKLAVQHNAPILVEVDQGGDVWEDNIKAEARRQGKAVKVIPVRASSIGSKAVRAQGVVAYYQQGRVHHVGEHEQLEVQQTTWVPGDKSSPDRLDAAVYALRNIFELGKKRLVAAAVSSAY